WRAACHEDWRERSRVTESGKSTQGTKDGSGVDPRIGANRSQRLALFADPQRKSRRAVGRDFHGMVEASFHSIFSFCGFCAFSWPSIAGFELDRRRVELPGRGAADFKALCLIQLH